MTPTNKNFNVLKEYCINLPKFCNLGKVIPSLDLYFVTQYAIPWAGDVH